MKKNTVAIWVPTEKMCQKETEWIEKELASVGVSTIDKLARMAHKIRDNAYTPYSNYHVGVGLLTKSGAFYAGVNAERVTYSETNHAEESSITSAIIGGEVKKSGRKFIRAIAICGGGENGPCGRCRQIILEHCDNCLVITVDATGSIVSFSSAQVLLPYAFGPSNLGKA